MSARKSHPTTGDGSFAPRQVVDGTEPTHVRATPSAHPSSSRPAKDDAGPPEETATQAASRIRLDVIAGPDAGKSRRLHGVRIVVGRSQECDVRVEDGSVSRRHMELVVSDECVLLRDLGSGNGTRVNGQRIDERVLRDQDEIAIGRTRFRFVDELGALRRGRRVPSAGPTPLPSAPVLTPTPTASPTPTRKVLNAERVAPTPRSRRGSSRGVFVVAGIVAAVLAIAIALAVRPLREAALQAVGSGTRAGKGSPLPPPPAPAPASPSAPADQMAAPAPPPQQPAPEAAPAPSAKPAAPSVAEKPEQSKPRGELNKAPSAKRRKE